MREIKFNRTDFIAVYDEVYSKEKCEELIKYINLLDKNAFITDPIRAVKEALNSKKFSI